MEQVTPWWPITVHGVEADVGPADYREGSTMMNNPVHPGVSHVARLATVVDVDDDDRMSFSALHLAVLDDERRLTLLDDRGWTVSGPANLWQCTTAEEIAADARMVVGPDEAYGDHTQADMAAEHWTSLADSLRQHGVLISGLELSRLPHDVELSKRVRRRLGRP